MQNAGCKALEKAREVSRGSAGNNLTPTNDQAPVAPNAHFACVLRYPGYRCPSQNNKGGNTARSQAQVARAWLCILVWGEGGRLVTGRGREGCGALGRAWEEVQSDSWN